MFSSGNVKSYRQIEEANSGQYDNLKKQDSTKSDVKKIKKFTNPNAKINDGKDNSFNEERASEEREQFLMNKDQLENKQERQERTGKERQQQQVNHKGKRQQIPILAKQETIEEDAKEATSCSRMLFKTLKNKKLFIPLIIILLIAAVYCIPFIDVDPKTPKSLPYIPFDFNNGPLRETTISQLKIDLLFDGQIQAAESLAFDSTGNLYMAVEGGLILYAHLNKSSPLKRSYYDNSAPVFDPLSQQLVTPPIDVSINTNDLVKIAELNGIRLMSNNKNGNTNGNNNNNNNNKRRARDNEPGSTWRRECQLDENIYGPNLYTTTAATSQSQWQQPNEIDVDQHSSKASQKHFGKFKINFGYSRCSRPLGIRLSQDESYLYVVDTLSGLYQINLRITERPYSTQRLVTKLIDFRNQRYKLLPVIDPSSDYLDNNDNSNVEIGGGQKPTLVSKTYLNVSFIAVDDLVIDYKAGTNKGDLIYLSIASQNWITFSYVFDLLEGRPSGAIVRYDTGSKQLAVINPNLLSHVRTSSLDLMNTTTRLYSTNKSSTTQLDEYYLGIGAPRLDENDVFDDRPLYFANGLELMDDRQAILIADTFNKRILKHYIRGPRRGTTDLWAWSPQYPDNIRRGHDKRHETYWVIGCASKPDKAIDFLEIVYMMPRVRKLFLKNYYLIGSLIEFLGKYLFGSTSVTDLGFSVKHGNAFSEAFCDGMMVLQYNKYGDVIRSIYSKDFPTNVRFYSQVNEIIDANNQEHALYLGSPSYKYVTKLVLPTDSYDIQV